eukprot:1396812-Alexandrium_andersonii.AAC.1
MHKGLWRTRAGGHHADHRAARAGPGRTRRQAGGPPRGAGRRGSEDADAARPWTAQALSLIHI